MLMLQSWKTLILLCLKETTKVVKAINGFVPCDTNGVVVDIKFCYPSLLFRLLFHKPKLENFLTHVVKCMDISLHVVHVWPSIRVFRAPFFLSAHLLM